MITRQASAVDKYLTETHEHIQEVQHRLQHVIANLVDRRNAHDASKLEEPEASGFLAMTDDARLNDLTYGSEEYAAVLREHTSTIQHHYANNDHHPEHFVDGI